VKKLIIALFVIMLLLAAGLGVVVATRPAQQAPSALEQPAAPPAADAPAPRVSPAVFLALVCVFNLSVVALLGAIALRRRFDSINPDK
jgi:hypothetical protein